MGFHRQSNRWLAQWEATEESGVLNDYWFDWMTYHPQTSIY
jgi:hypothetical protein